MMPLNSWLVFFHENRIAYETGTTKVPSHTKGTKKDTGSFFE